MDVNEHLRALQALGQSIWLDYIRRAMLKSGELQALIASGVSGVTSNPSIFEKAITGSADYDSDMEKLGEQGYDPQSIYEQLAIADITAAADLLREVYDRSLGQDGFVSLEVCPELARDTAGTISEARRLFQAINRPNVMIKVPATPEGVPAVEALIAEGININITLIFSLSQYEAIAEAYVCGLEKRLAAGLDIQRVASVASFFISRVDNVVDPALDAIGNRDLQGQIAIANARLAYAHFKTIFRGERWERLVRAGGQPQRPLWASTGVKNHRYPDTLYVDNLIGPNTVNTLPPATLNAFMHHGTIALTLEKDLEKSLEQLKRLRHLGVDLEVISEKLQEEGVAAFAKAYEALLAGIAEKLLYLKKDRSTFSSSLGMYQSQVEQALQGMERDRILVRLWAHDHTLWKPDPVEISNRLGWLHIAEKMEPEITRLQDFADEARAAGFTAALLLGMGGSSLAPEVLYKTFDKQPGYLDLVVLDSTHPQAVIQKAGALDLARTLFIVSTKSGTTTETLSFFKYFYNLAVNQLGTDRAGEHFVAITDPGSQLEMIGREHHFRRIFLNDPTIGGRYAALSYVGLVPAALIGLDLVTLLDRALRMSCNCESSNSPASGDKQGAQLGTILGTLANAGRDKATFIISPQIASFGDWVEQLIAESTGKEGRGILPVIGEPLAEAKHYAPDRLFVQIWLGDDTPPEKQIRNLEAAGHPVVRLQLADRFDLGAQFFLWETATAIAGHFLGINPFDQPDVEAAKKLAHQMVQSYLKEGHLPGLAPTLQSDRLMIYADPLLASTRPKTPREGLISFLDAVQPNGYISFQAYLAPSAETDKALQELRQMVWAYTGAATTVGYGPRYLHSTGQLHKGDAGKGCFIQLTDDITEDIPIPDQAGSAASSMTFGTLIQAQAMGDRQALLDGGRRVLRIHLVGDAISGLQQLLSDSRRDNG